MFESGNLVLINNWRLELVTTDTMAGGHNASGKKRNVQQPTQLGIVPTTSRRDSADATNESSPSDEHYELASDQLVSDVTTGDTLTIDKDPKIVGSSNEATDSDDNSGKDPAREEDEVNPNSAFALDILSRKTGKKVKQLTAFNDCEMYQPDLRSDSEAGESEHEDELYFGQVNKADEVEKPRSQSLDRGQAALKRSEKSKKEKPRSRKELPVAEEIQVGPSDFRLRTEEEKRRALELAFQANVMARKGNCFDAVHLLTEAIEVNANDYR